VNWDISFLEQKASITRCGGILLGHYFTCDGFDWDREIAVITHIHSDHIAGFEQMLGYHDLIFCSPETKELLIALSGDWLRLRRNLLALPYEVPYRYKGEQLTLYSTKHILGSVQVLVESQEGARIAYSGEFIFPDTKPIKADVLVLDATFGNPNRVVKSARAEIIEYLVSLVRKELETSPVCILAHRGKLQEVMAILSEANIKVPFLCLGDILQISRVYQNYGINLGNILSLEDSATQEVIKRGERHIVFYLLGPRLVLPPVHYTKIRVSRWGTKEDFIKTAEDKYVVALSDHADFNGLLQYVRECQPKLVITDNYRGGDAVALAEAIRNELHIEAKAMPS
jgi:putative mRNA 3-end processing factor